MRSMCPQQENERINDQRINLDKRCSNQWTNTWEVTVTRDVCTLSLSLSVPLSCLCHFTMTTMADDISRVGTSYLPEHLGLSSGLWWDLCFVSCVCSRWCLSVVLLLFFLITCLFSLLIKFFLSHFCIFCLFRNIEDTVVFQSENERLKVTF